MKTRTEITNPMKLLVNMGLPINHITYNPDVEQDYYIIRGQKHDGLLCFTRDLFKKALMCLVNRSTFYKPDTPTDEQQKNMKYEIGDIKLTSKYGRYTLQEGTDSEVTINGVDETLKIPVKCYWR